MKDEQTYTAFLGTTHVVTAGLRSMLLRVKEALTDSPTETLLIFDDATGNQIDFDLSGTPEEMVERAKRSTEPATESSVEAPTGSATKSSASTQTASRGRPKLGVVSREVSLLPRHWQWLEEQPNGASAALRRLVDDARKREPLMELSRRARDAASRFMWSMAGNLPNFEEASRALFAGDGELMRQLIRDWPTDIRNHVDKMVQASEQHAREHRNSVAQDASNSEN